LTRFALPTGGAGLEWRISPGAVPYPEAVALMETRVADIAAGQAITGTFTYGADGTLTLTQTNAQASALHTGQWPYFVLASNDSFTTQALAAKGTLLVASGV